MKKKVLFILHLPPPINGAAVVGSLIQESGVINTNFEADYINLATSFSLDHIGKGGVKKIGATLGIIKKVVGALRHKEYDLCYMTLTAKGAGLLQRFFGRMCAKIVRQTYSLPFSQQRCGPKQQAVF